MRDFIIYGDSGCDLTKAEREKYNIDYVMMHFTLDGKEYPADLDWEKLPAKDFYDSMRNGLKYKSSQASESQYIEDFSRALEKGCDILSISSSSGLSASYGFSVSAREKLLLKYPDAKIFCIDSLISGYGLGYLCLKAGEMQKAGATIEDIAKWLEENKLRVNQEGTTEKLTYLKQAGRVSAAAAFFGGILSVKPIVFADALGRNVAIEKTKGRKASLERVAERLLAEIDDDSDIVGVTNGDCPEAAQAIIDHIKAKIGDKVTYRTGYIGPIVGGSSGPGTVIAYVFGKDVRSAVNK